MVWDQQDSREKVRAAQRLRTGDPFVVQDEGPASIPMSVPGDSRDHQLVNTYLVILFFLCALFSFSFLLDLRPMSCIVKP